MTLPGSARERTANAWGRTALGMAGFAVLLLRLGIAHHAWFEVAAGGIAAALTAGFALHGRWAYRRTLSAPSVLTMRIATAAFTVIGLFAIMTFV